MPSLTIKLGRQDLADKPRQLLFADSVVFSDIEEMLELNAKRNIERRRTVTEGPVDRIFSPDAMSACCAQIAHASRCIAHMDTAQVSWIEGAKDRWIGLSTIRERVATISQIIAALAHRGCSRRDQIAIGRRAGAGSPRTFSMRTVDS